MSSVSSSTSSSPSFTTTNARLLVVSRYHPDDVSFEGNGQPILSSEDTRNDGWDLFNHPRHRRALILRELASRSINNANNNGEKGHRIVFVRPAPPTNDVAGFHLKDSVYNKIHSPGLLDFLSTGWNRWDAMGEEGQDPSSTVKRNLAEEDDTAVLSSKATLPLIPGNVSLPRNDPYQRPSRNVMGQVGYYCTDTCTPLFAELLEELLWDMETVQMAVQMALSDENNDNNKEEEEKEGSSSSKCPAIVYALCTHPGHHAAKDAYGGYCYVNHSALAARLMQERLSQQQQNNNENTPPLPLPKVAVLDVDYHCGNGSASIFYDDPSVLVVSIHCHPDWDYPFHSGFEDERGVGDAVGTTLHLPLLPGTTWDKSYKATLERAMNEIQAFGAQGLVLSLGLDTHAGDPCAIRRAGFLLQGDDYKEMGALIGKYVVQKQQIPVVVVQEGGYKMDKVPVAAADVLLGLAGMTSASN
ncbi:acetylpolyamine aminohydrolase [Nitzschia inconspicua]|uniref:Acetylpolyamine aminohydrolase n=1 Tax=Nitzschia inconspicua TaxID=303405 RepID=A0A9K3M4F9_9STRA|nr:acetylpolyamine aminohydrolase [Nitzschia inconspicua]